MKNLYFLLFTLSLTLTIQSQNISLVYANPVSSTGLDDGRSVVTDASDNLYAIGKFSAVTDFDPSAGTANLTPVGNEDVYVVKYNSAGAYQWAFQIGSVNTDIGYGISIDNSGNVYVTGSFGGTADFDPSAATVNKTPVGADDIFVAKYNSSGVYQWAFNIGSTGSDYGRSISVDPTGNVNVTGTFAGLTDFDPSAGTANFSSVGVDDIFVAKYSTGGVYQWAFGIGSTASDIGYSISSDNNGNVYITGSFAGTADFNPAAAVNNLTPVSSFVDIFVAKYSNLGAYQWAFGIGSSNIDEGYGIKADPAGNIYVTGQFNITADFDPSAGSAILTTTGQSDIFVAKYTTAGAYVWAFNVGGFNFDYGYGITLDNTNGVYLTGMFMATTDFDPSSGVANITATGGGIDAFVAKYTTAAGAYQWAFKLASAGIDRGYGITTGTLDKVYATGMFSAVSVDFDPNATTYILNNAGSDDGFIASYCQVPLTPVSVTSGTNLSICTGKTTTLSATGAGIVSWYSTATSTTALGTGTNYATPTLTTGASASTYTFYAEAVTCTMSPTRVAITVTVNPLPVVTISSSSPSLCIGSTMTLTANGANTYTWNTGPTTQAINVSPVVNTPYTVTATDINGCVNSNTVLVPVNQLPTVTVNGPTTTVCSSSTSILTGGGAATYTWNTGPTTANISVNPLTTTSYTVTGTDGTTGCKNFATITLTVIPLPTVTISGGGSTVCPGTPVTLTGNGAVTYTWSTSVTSQTASVSPASTTVYSVVGTGTNNCTNSASKTVTVFPQPNIIVSSTHSVVCTLPSQETATLTAGGANTYTWSTSTNGNTIAVSPTTTTQYTVIGTDANGCDGTTVFTQTASTCAGINEANGLVSELSLFPNPTNGVVTLMLPNNFNGSVEVYTSIGSLVYRSNGISGKSEIDLSKQSNGIYIVKVIGNNSVRNLKLIKE